MPDLVAPGAPVLTATDPPSPGSGTSPRVRGRAEPASTIRLYSDDACRNLVGTGPEGELSTSGITVHVPAGTTTSLHGTATDAAGNTSACSAEGLTYVEAPVLISAEPALYPSFDPTVQDYVTRCDGTSPVAVSVDAPNGAVVSVDGSAPAEGTDTHTVALDAGQEFGFSVDSADYAGSFHVRCLPSDFPDWSFTRWRRPNNPFYLVDPNISLSGGVARWVVMFNGDGVPVWWANPAIAPVDSKVLGDGTLAWARWDGSGYELHALDGTPLRTVSAVGGTTDIHDLQQLPNGDLLVLQYRPRSHVDLSAFGGPADATVIDGVIQEIDASGDLVWEWNSKDHIALEETGRWWPSVLAGSAPYDIVHINAVEPDGDALLVSFRHTDAIYRIDRATGDVIWKLGGTPTPQRLEIRGDPYGAYPFGGQHDPRRQTDGTVTVHDNATGLTALSGHPPRSVRYLVDEKLGRARVVEQITDPRVPSSFCCGSSTRSPDGSWLMSWDTNLVTEFDEHHHRVFDLALPDGFSYRAFPVPPDRLEIADIRAGMNAMFPRD